MPVPTSGLPPTVAAKWMKIGRDHEGGDRTQELDDREHALEVGDSRENPATNSAGATVAPSPIPVRPEPTSVSAWLEGTCDAEDRDSRGQQDHADERKEWIAHLVSTKPRTMAVITAPASSGR